MHSASSPTQKKHDLPTIPTLGAPTSLANPDPPEGSANGMKSVAMVLQRESFVQISHTVDGRIPAPVDK